MTLFTEDDLSSCAADQLLAMDKLCTVTVPAADVDDAYGGTTAGSTTVTAGIACRVGSPNGSDQKVAERLGIVMDAAVTLPYGTDVTDRTTIAASNGKSYDVTYVNTEQSYQIAVRALCRTVRSET